jgi:hypothetical protein
MTDDVTLLLREMRNQQQPQLERSAQSLQHHAEAIQNRALKATQRVMWVPLPLSVVVLRMLMWPSARGWVA